MKVAFIEARTGGSCCSYENHFRGPYKSVENAKRRIAYYRTTDSKYWPVASQYASRGSYTIEEYDAEEISGNRVIINDRVYPKPEYIEVNQDGTINIPDHSEEFSREI